MINLAKSELRSLAKKRSISGYKSMSKNELIYAISISKPTRNNKKETKKSLMKPSKKKILKSIIKKSRKFLTQK